ncbi:M48 family metalloprotease [Micromonospora sp. WMMD1082]|uniref:M48 family metalloprotease n=1 Tax=Micromonospora sp. WMMD1082 TaxID=3016104 RepID=UPI002417D205|nr:M48 family metalloprotease [Micromonospora sp. WMMD1082]MDG4797354.1 M48 family metalloprotease [Micromonospora sp. WMMD1082]
MFDHFVWSVLVAPVAVVVAARLLARRFRPDIAAIALAWSAVVAAAASAVNLATFALKAFAELPAVARRFDWSDHVVRADTAHVPWVSWFSLVWLLVAGVAVTRAWVVHRRAMVSARRYDRLLPGTYVVVLDDDSVDAFAVPGDPGHIIVTRGMRDALDEQQYEALLAHERAHLVGRHHRLVLLVALAAAVHPVFRWLLREVEYLVERAADEYAAVAVGSRRTVARAVGAAALAATGRRRHAAALGLAPSRPELGGAGVVPRRVASLLAAPPVLRSPVIVGVTALMAAGTVVWTGECVYDLFELLAHARDRKD